MITWKIWRQLRNPSFSHPLLRRTLKMQQRMSYPVARTALEVLGGLFLCVSMLSPVFLLLMLLLVLLIFNGTIYSLIWAVRTSGSIARLHASGQYDLLCVTPDGRIGIHWAVCVGTLHRSNRLTQIHNAIRGSLAGILIGVLLIGFIGFFRDIQNTSGDSLFSNGEKILNDLTVFVNMLLFLLALYTDHIHSITLGVVVGMSVPLLRQRPFDSQIIAAALYLLLQVSIYGAALVILAGVNRIFAGTTAPLILFLLPFLRMALFFAIREGVMMLLWRRLADRLEGGMTQPGFPEHNLTQRRAVA
ncbi:MAG: hypothetical protein K8I60_02805, partial [Anaerolineae bacterium]|nr:hypothetical protein [Anaerolineae bacterium]